MVSVVPDDFNKDLYTPLAELDGELQDLLDRETWRQFSTLELIASGSITSVAALEANGSILTNKVSEGLPGARYYGGTEFVDKLETMTQRRALQAFRLDASKWGVNVQPYSGSIANLAIFTALLHPQDRIMGLGLSDGGHLTHGHYTAKKKISATSIFFQTLPYQVTKTTGYIDYDLLQANFNLFKPRLLICGASAYPRDWDYKHLRAIADSQDAYLMSDMAHIAGLIAGGAQNNPFDYCDVVTTTTNKTLSGPRAAMVFYRKDKHADMEARVNDAIFPGCQGAAHNHTIAAIAATLKLTAKPEFKAYAKAVLANARTAAQFLQDKGYKIQTGGTDNHLVLCDLRPLGITGNKVEKLCELAAISVNKNPVVGDMSAQTPGGIRIGFSALTSRSMGTSDIIRVASFVDRAIQLGLQIQEKAGSKLLKNFMMVATSGEGETSDAIRQLRGEVKTFARQFPLAGVKDMSNIKTFPDED